MVQARGTAAPLFTRPFVQLALCELAYFAAAGLTIPITPLFAEGPLGANELWVGITVGAFSLSTILLRPWAGRAVDRRGRRPLLIGGALLCAVTLAAHAVTTTLPVLIALRLVLGVAEAFFFVAAFAALADLAPPGRAGEALSFNSLALYLGIALGPVLGEAMLDLGGFAAAWLAAAALALLATLLAAALSETAPERMPDAPPTPLIHSAAIGPGLAIFFGTAAMGGFLAFVALHAVDVGLGGSAAVLLLFGLVVVFCRIALARLPDRVAPSRMIAVALGLAALGMGVAAALVSVTGLLVGAAILGVGIAFLTPGGLRRHAGTGAGGGAGQRHGDGQHLHRPRLRRGTGARRVRCRAGQHRSRLRGRRRTGGRRCGWRRALPAAGAADHESGSRLTAPGCGRSS